MLDEEPASAPGPGTQAVNNLPLRHRSLRAIGAYGRALLSPARLAAVTGRHVTWARYGPVGPDTPFTDGACAEYPHGRGSPPP